MLDFILIPLKFFMHIDEYLLNIVQQFGFFSYVILFLIIFFETGIVITPFLPGDSLIFVAGTLAAQGYLNIFVILLSLIIAAIIGDSLNYSIGKMFGRAIIKRNMVKIEYIRKAELFYDKYGGKAIIFARFVPIIRTFAPFVAGIAKMKYSKFIFYNIAGGIIWVSLFAIGGFLFGNIPIVKDNLSWVIIIIILLSGTPFLLRFFKKKK